MYFAIDMLICHVDGQGYVEKYFFGCVARKFKQEIKFLPVPIYAKNIDRILKCLDIN